MKECFKFQNSYLTHDSPHLTDYGWRGFYILPLCNSTVLICMSSILWFFTLPALLRRSTMAISFFQRRHKGQWKWAGIKWTKNWNLFQKRRQCSAKILTTAHQMLGILMSFMKKRMLILLFLLNSYWHRRKSCPKAVTNSKRRNRDSNLNKLRTWKQSHIGENAKFYQYASSIDDGKSILNSSWW